MAAASAQAVISESPQLDPLVEPPPSVATEEAEEIAARVFGIEGTATPLESERDANFRLEAADAAHVLKVYNAAEPDAVADMQTRAMLHAAVTDPSCRSPA